MPSSATCAATWVWREALSIKHHAIWFPAGRPRRRRHGPLATRWTVAVLDEKAGFAPFGWHTFRWAADWHARRRTPRAGRPVVVLSVEGANKLRAMAGERLIRTVMR